MNLRALANGLTSGINPNVTATVKISTGFGMDAAHRQVPTYADPVPIIVQPQALSQREIEHLDSLNISNVTRAVYANIQLSGVDRKTQSGGDLLYFNSAVWLVVAVLERWSASGWTKVALQAQMDATL